ncbi:MAG TPA: DUF5667 domain-containing protein [Patescibacteria group bacterium]|jgi:hypothetical protein|nr:DUF5667 domain-containing protein [Patescibacteria group bacterium]
MKDELKQFYKNNPAPNADQSEVQSSLILSEDAKQRVKDNIFSKLGAQVADELAVKPGFSWTKIILRGYIVAPLVFVLLIAGTTVASANSLPGDALYPVKRQVENARLLIAPTEEAKLELQVNFAQKRLEEAEKLSASNTNLQTDLRTDNDEGKQNDAQGDEQKSDQPGFGRHGNVRQNTKDALKFLNQTQKNWQQKGSQDKARSIENRINQFQQDLKIRTHSDDDQSQNESGAVKGARTGSSRSSSADVDLKVESNFLLHK